MMKKQVNSLLKAMGWFLIYIACQAIIAISITQNAILGSIASNALFLIVLFLIFYIKRVNIKEYLQINGVDLKKCIFIIILSLVLNVIFQSIQLLFPDNMRQDLITESSVRLTGNIYLAFIAIVILAPLTEEILFRGLVFGTLKQNMNVYVAALLQAILFGIMHVNIIWVLIAIPTALLYAFLMERYKSIVAPLIGHIAVNVLSFILG